MSTNTTNAKIKIESTVKCPYVDCVKTVEFSTELEVDLDTQTIVELLAYKKALTDKLYQEQFHQIHGSGFIGGDWYCPEHPKYPSDDEDENC